MRLLGLFCGAPAYTTFAGFQFEEVTFMNPKPSLVQVLVLHEIDDGTVWFDLATGRWHATYLKSNISLQMGILQRDGYINIVDDVVSLTPMGRQVLDRRPYADVVEKINS